MDTLVGRIRAAQSFGFEPGFSAQYAEAICRSTGRPYKYNDSLSLISRHRISINMEIMLELPALKVYHFWRTV